MDPEPTLGILGLRWEIQTELGTSSRQGAIHIHTKEQLNIAIFGHQEEGR